MSSKPNAEVEKAAEDEETEDDALDLSAASVDSLARAGDADGLFLLAKAARSGTHGRSKDMPTAFSAYRAAGDLGHADADYAAALFYLTGTGTEKDPKEAAARLRRSADKGNLDAKVTLGNFYELGIHYAKDTEKADVWYRNAARAAQIAAPPGSPALVRALAALGSVRHAELFAQDPTASAEEVEAGRKKARVRGGGLQGKLETGAMPARDSTPDVPPGHRAPADPRPAPDTKSRSAKTPVPLAAEGDPAATKPTRAQKSDADLAKDAETARRAKLAELSKKAKAPSKLTGKAGLGAFLYALLFSATAFGAAFAAEAGAKELLSHGTPVPLFGTRVHLVFPLLFGVVGVLPQLLVYKLATVARSVVFGAAMFGMGWVLYGTGKLALGDARLSQAIAFAGAAFLSALLVQGLFGGSKEGAKS